MVHNPGAGGCRVVCYDIEDEFMVNEELCIVPRKPIIEDSRRHLGKLTSDVAEYYNVVTGLRRLFYKNTQSWFLTLQFVEIRSLLSDNSRVHTTIESSNLLLPLYHIAMGLIRKIAGTVHFEHSTGKTKGQIEWQNMLQLREHHHWVVTPSCFPQLGESTPDGWLLEMASLQLQ